ncbi:MAG: tyrosine-type recombinase/integrase, partial [Patescibacteria group bacterium]
AKSLPQYIAEMLLHFEQKNITTVNQITAEAVQKFFFHWKHRKNKTSGAGLSISHINNGALAINNFIKFLRLTGKNDITLKLPREKTKNKIPEILTQEEIKSLYEATYHLDKRMNPEAFGQRDRAMLAIYYGCGLRKTEGSSLEISDILTEKKLIFVRKGKGSKERYVPITEQGLKDIQEYLQCGRAWFLSQRQKKKVPPLGELKGAFFVNVFGEPMSRFYQRLKLLKEQSGINKNIGLHTLRHSIATHLLQAGMDMEQIRKFLGHSSLESTQIYTHIVNEL